MTTRKRMKRKGRRTTKKGSRKRFWGG